MRGKVEERIGQPLVRRVMPLPPELWYEIKGAAHEDRTTITEWVINALATMLAVRQRMAEKPEEEGEEEQGEEAESESE